MKRVNPMFKDETATAAARFADKRSYIRRGRRYLFGADMKFLREAVYQRSEGYCEMPLSGIIGICQRNIDRETMELHHEPPLSQGGDDSLDGCLASCARCHVARHGRTIRKVKA
jgi:5-methylcytosine-specific restriction endonuclease McrA